MKPSILTLLFLLTIHHTFHLLRAAPTTPEPTLFAPLGSTCVPGQYLACESPLICSESQKKCVPESAEKPAEARGTINDDCVVGEFLGCAEGLICESEGSVSEGDEEEGKCKVEIDRTEFECTGNEDCTKEGVCLRKRCRAKDIVEDRRKSGPTSEPAENKDEMSAPSPVAVPDKEESEGKQVKKVAGGFVKVKGAPGRRKFCLSSQECEQGEFCQIYDVETGSGFCRKKSKVGMRCTSSSGLDVCVENAYCDNDHMTGVEMCKEALGEGGRCLGSNACRTGFACDNTVCRKVGSVGAGGVCQVSSVCGEGLFCAAKKKGGSSRCVSMKKIGETCAIRGGIAEPCMGGFCGVDGRCVQYRAEGESCSLTSECVSKTECILTEPGSDNGKASGICLSPTKIVRSRGQECNIKQNNCDTSVQLYCDKVNKANVCVQKRTFACDPTNSYEKCLDADKSCQRSINPITRQYKNGHSCQVKQTIVPKGGICTAGDGAVCDYGTMCNRITGDQSAEASEKLSTEFDATSAPSTGYCVEEVEAGDDCSNRFETKCKEGDTCVKGKCAVGVTVKSAPALIAGLNDTCIAGKCGQGLYCSKNAICILQGEQAR